jgi:SAM-dependent methyltransferase
MPEGRPFERSARLYDLMYAGKDYADAAGAIHELVEEAVPGARDLLDVGCGTGRHLEQLARWYATEGLDMSPGLLERARERCPGASFHEGDMTAFDLGRSFDVITCLFAAIGYVRTVDAMRAAIARMAAHLRTPGVLLVEPWFTPESFWDDHLAANFHDEPEIKLAWMYRQRREGSLSVLDVNHLVAEPGGIEHFVERQELGLFTRDEMLAAFQDVGLSVRYREGGVWNRGLYVARRA